MIFFCFLVPCPCLRLFCTFLSQSLLFPSFYFSYALSPTHSPLSLSLTLTHYSEAARLELDTFDGLSVGLRQTGRGIATRYNIAAAGLRAASLVSQSQSQSVGVSESVRERQCVWERESLWERETVCVCVCVHMCACMWERMCVCESVSQSVSQFYTLWQFRHRIVLLMWSIMINKYL